MNFRIDRLVDRLESRTSLIGERKACKAEAARPAFWCCCNACATSVAAMDRPDQWKRPAWAPIAATFSAAGLEQEDKRLRAEDRRLRAAPVAQDLVPSPAEEQLATDARRAKIERASEKARRMSRRFRRGER
jgi:hypothetical protein